MKTATSFALALAVAAVVAPVVGRALSDRGGAPFTQTRAFTIDGRRFRLESPGVDGLALVERELARNAKAGPDLPRGLDAEHVLRLETETGPVEIAVGRMVRTDKDLLARLRSSGWACREPAARGAVAHLTKDREASFVVLEKDQGRFLAIRRVAR